MIRDLSLTLKKMLQDQEILGEMRKELANAEISFEHPTALSAVKMTTVNLFLYDIQENIELRSNEPSIEYNDGMARIIPPPFRIACSYLVTAWPNGGEELPLQEHRLLSQILESLIKYPTIPEKFLQGRLKGQELPLPIITLYASSTKPPGEFWSSLQVKMRPSIVLKITLSVPAIDIYSIEKVPLVTEVRSNYVLKDSINPIQNL